MLKPTDEKIKEIADYLKSGMICYYHKETGDIKYNMDFDSWSDIDLKAWKDELKEIKKNGSNYLSFEKLESWESFKIMENFVESVDDANLRNDLFNALNRPKPLSNFKWIVDNSGDYRQKWFDFKNKNYFEYVQNQFEAYLGIEENED